MEYGPQSPKYLLSGPLQEKIANPCCIQFKGLFSFYEMDAPLFTRFSQATWPAHHWRVRADPLLAIKLGIPSSSLSSGEVVSCRGRLKDPKDTIVTGAEPSPWQVFFNPLLWSWKRGEERKSCWEMALHDTMTSVEVDGTAWRPYSGWS